MRRLYHRLRALLRRCQFEQDLQDELTTHLEMDTKERMERGESAESARHGARRDFGNVLQSAEATREIWGWTRLEQFREDLRYALRQMKRSPGFTLIAILTLALGIGANTAIFSVVNAILLRPLPYSDPDRLVRIVENISDPDSPGSAPRRTATMSTDEFLEWRTQTTTLSHMALQVPNSMTLSGRDEAVRLSGMRVSPSMFPMLGIPPILGRVFEPNEEEPGANRVVILSYGAWQRYFGLDPLILDRPLTFDDTAYSIVGVMPRDFAFPDSRTEFWTPLTVNAQYQRLLVSARLKEGITIEAAAAEANAISGEFRGEPPADPASPNPGPPRIEIVSWKDELVAPIRSALFVFIVAVGFVLLIACINVANLFLARATARHREIAVRMALGAGRGRMLRQLLTEGLILALFGGTAGCALAFAGSRVLRTFGQSLARVDLESGGNTIPRLSEASIDVSVLLFTLAITIATGVLFGLAPAIHFRGVSPIHALVLRAGSSSSGSGLNVARRFMVVSQVGLTMVLLLGAGLLIRSFVKLAHVDLGYDPTNVLTFQIAIPYRPGRSPDMDSWAAFRVLQQREFDFAEQLVGRLQSVPGIQSAAFTNLLPMVQLRVLLILRTASGGPPIRIPRGNQLAVSPDYLRVMGMRVINGRGFNETDGPGQPKVFLITRTLAREHFGNVNPIGQTIDGAGLDPGEIVGIVDDIREFSLQSEPEPQLFFNIRQVPGPPGVVPMDAGGVYYAIRTDKEAGVIIPQIRSIVRQFDPTMALDNVATMDQIVLNSITTPHSYAMLLGIFATVALALAAIGMYGILAYFVTQRTQEIGIRMALGADGSEVLLLVLRQGLSLTLVGVLLGFAGGAVVTRYLETMLFGLTPLDPITFIIVPALFVGVALVASYVPARYATKIDPLVALRHE